MAGEKKSVLFLFFLFNIPLLQGAKILTICFIGGSHYLLMDEISRILHNNGHDVRMFLQIGEGFLPGYKLQPSPYHVSTYSLDEKHLEGFQKNFIKDQKKYFAGRHELNSFLALMGQLSYQCNVTLHQTEILNFLKNENFDITIIDVFNPCSFLVCEKLGLPYIAFFPGTFANALRVKLPTPLSYVPLFQSQLTDRIDFIGRLKNIFMFFGSYIVDKKSDSIFQNVIEEHFPVGSRPTLHDLHLKAELWFYNVDFTIEFPRPLLPHIQYIGGIMAKPAKPVSQELEDFIAESGENGFIVVTMGSMLSSVPRVEFVKEMNAGFAKVPQKVIWRYQKSQWPEEIEIAPNVKIMDWLPQNDLIAHPKARLFVTHGGMNSVNEAVYHGIPVLGIPLFWDQHENMVRIKAKNMGEYIAPQLLKSDNFAETIQDIIGNKSYKMSAMKLSSIRKSQPFPPDQQLLRWVEHIIQSGGGGHLHPYSYQQPWYQQYLLDVILFLIVCVTVAVYLIVTLFRVILRNIWSAEKQKQN